jgi:hypothetical protein
MILLILFSLFVLIYTFILYKEDDNGIIFSAIFSIFLSVIVFLIVGSCVYVIDEHLVPDEAVVIKRTKSQELVSLEDKNIIQGGFVLGTGKINNNDYYYYVVETDKGHKIDKVSINNCYIRYTDDNPRIEEYRGRAFKDWVMWIYAMPSKHYYIVYVPKNTIVTDYCIDLK